MGYGSARLILPTKDKEINTQPYTYTYQDVSVFVEHLVTILNGLLI